MEPRTDQQSARRGILVVDGDVQIQRLLDLSLRNAGFDVRTASTAPEALAAIEQHRPDLIVSEVRLEGGPDGYELCREIKRRTDGPAIAFVFLAEQNVETRMRGVEAGADDFLAKPIYVQEVLAHARSLLQRRERDRLEALARGDERFTGDLEDFPLVDLLGALGANHKSGVVVMTAAGGARGEIYFREGAVVDAEAGRLSGLDAVCRLFSWTQGRFEIEWKSIRRKDAVGKEPSALIMEALRRLDEWRRLLAELPALDTIFEVDYHLLAERLAEIPDEVNGVLRLFDGQRMFIHVIDDSGLSDLDGLAVIGKLYREEIIHDVRSKPDAVSPPGADIEGWLSEAAGPFRAPTAMARRDLFGAAPDVGASLPRRATAPIEPLEEAALEPAVDERRERFTDRLIAEGATAVPVARAPAMAPETTQLGLPAAPVVPRVAMKAAETTQQGLAQPPPLSTRPGFAAVTPPAPRLAREIPTEVAPPVRTPPLGSPVQAGDGVPEPLLPQSAEPAIVIPPPTGTTAPRLGTALPVEPMPNAPAELRTVAGEILARAPTAKLFEQAAGAPLAKRVTDIGLGPDRASGAGRAVDERALVPTAKSGEVVAVVAKAGKAGGAAADERPLKKIILDPEIPEQDLDEEQAGASPWVKRLVIVGGLGLAVLAVWAVFKNTGHKRRTDDVVAVATPVAQPIAAALTPETADAATVADGGKAVASAAPPAPPPVAAHVPPLVVEERMLDPKLARDLPKAFPILLAACRQAFTEKRAKDAETACLAAKDANPDSAEACVLLGHVLFDRKKRREALQWAERAVALDPARADAYVIIGGVKQAADDTAAAKAAYRKYLELAPNGQYAADLRTIVDSP